jgi:hypothetical protein
MALQTQRISKAFWGSLCLGALFSYTQFENDSTVLHFVVGGLASYLAFIPLREFSIWKTVKDVYKGDVTAMKKDATEIEKALKEVEAQAKPVAAEIRLNIVNVMGEPIGTYKDFPYHEQITVQADDGTFWQFKFDGTMNLDDGITRPLDGDELLLYPGVIYKCIGQVEFNPPSP